MRYNRKSVSVTASADSPAISLSDMKVFLRVDGTADDDIITAYIATATEAVKQYLRQAGTERDVDDATMALLISECACEIVTKAMLAAPENKAKRGRKPKLVGTGVQKGLRK